MRVRSLARRPVDGRLVKKSEANVRELFEQCEANSEGCGHLLAARQVLKRAIMAFLFENDFIVARPAQCAPRVARNLAEKLVGFYRNVVKIALCDQRPGLM